MARLSRRRARELLSCSKHMKHRRWGQKTQVDEISRALTLVGRRRLLIWYSGWDKQSNETMSTEISSQPLTWRKFTSSLVMDFQRELFALCSHLYHTVGCLVCGLGLCQSGLSAELWCDLSKKLTWPTRTSSNCLHNAVSACHKVNTIFYPFPSSSSHRVNLLVSFARIWSLNWLSRRLNSHDAIKNMS